MKQIPGYPDYSVTKDGRVWSKPRRCTKGGWLKPGKDKFGYLHVVLCNGKTHVKRIHRIVLETFVGPRPLGMECRHLDGNPINNRLENLKWGTRSENQQDAVRHGTSGGLKSRGERGYFSKLSDRDRRLIFSVYHDGAYTRRELADHFGMSWGAIADITRDNYWAKEV